MKKNKVKGFTLIELIVVMAVFMVVLLAATSMMEPVSKMVTLADVRESGAAQVNSIGSFLQSELGSAEYLMVTNTAKTTDTECQAMVNDYVKRYYEGALKNGATAAAPAYGQGKVHVMTIDNANDGNISTKVYNVSFALNSSCGSAVEHDDNAINKAYYVNTKYRIELLGNMMTSDTEVPTFDPTTLSASDTTFRIKAFVTRGAGTSNPKTYEFSTNATVPFVNIMERTGCASGKYFVFLESGTVGTSSYKAEIVDLASAVLPSVSAHPEYTLTRSKGGLSSKSSIWVVPDAGSTGTGYTFVYSYGSEMNTN